MVLKMGSLVWGFEVPWLLTFAMLNCGVQFWVPWFVNLPRFSEESMRSYVFTSGMKERS